MPALGGVAHVVPARSSGEEAFPQSCAGTNARYGLSGDPLAFLLRKGQSTLSSHPERERFTYLQGDALGLFIECQQSVTNGYEIVDQSDLVNAKVMCNVIPF